MREQPPAEPTPRRSRLEDEVIEILSKSDRPPSNVLKFQSHVRRRRFRAVSTLRGLPGLIRLTSLHLLVTAVVLAVLAALVDDASQLLGRILAVLSIVALVALFIRAFRSPERHSVKTWRGRDIEITPPRRSDWIERKLSRFRRPRF